MPSFGASRDLEASKRRAKLAREGGGKGREGGLGLGASRRGVHVRMRTYSFIHPLDAVSRWGPLTDEWCSAKGQG